MKIHLIANGMSDIAASRAELYVLNATMLHLSLIVFPVQWGVAAADHVEAGEELHLLIVEISRNRFAY